MRAWSFPKCEIEFTGSGRFKNRARNRVVVRNQADPPNSGVRESSRNARLNLPDPVDSKRTVHARELVVRIRRIRRIRVKGEFPKCEIEFTGSGRFKNRAPERASG